MDPALERLVHQADRNTGLSTGLPCSNVGHYRATPPPGDAPCVFDHVAFKKIINQYGFAFAPAAMYPARTTGYGGFQVSVQGIYTSIDSDAGSTKSAESPR